MKTRETMHFPCYTVQRERDIHLCRKKKQENIANKKNFKQ